MSIAPPSDRHDPDPDPEHRHDDHAHTPHGEEHARRGDRDAHAHGWRAHAAFARTGGGRLLVGAVALLALATVVGLIALWPGAAPQSRAEAAGLGATVGAEVLSSRVGECPGPARQQCRSIVARLDDGERVPLDLGPVELVASLGQGDGIRLQEIPQPGGEPAFAFAGVERRGTLLWLAAAFGLLIVVMARWRGVLALFGFALSLFVIVEFVVPAILGGSAPLPVALVGALAVMFVTVGLTYGLTAQSAAAALGIAVTLLIATLLGTLAIGAAKLDGDAGELSSALVQSAGALSLQGIVLAGLVLGALGVLADMAVTQASAVMAVRRANPSLGAARLYREGYAVGRDHLVATTHTLMLAYAGATLPLLLVLQSIGSPPADALNMHDLAEPIIATLVGSIALLLSVPITTGLAAAVVSRVPAAALPESGHSHAH